ncbi:Hydrogenase expression/formation protein HypE [uncultured Desulfatiglans sp.]|nr:Hydrogenase expression/formation protein HypE [uncultured Desulfatiglans sp.]
MGSNHHILLDHGSGGEASQRFVQEFVLKFLSNPFLEKMDDSAELIIEGERWAFTTDSYVVDPIFFPGGDIGSLSVNGTVNDLSMQGARPLFLTLAFILEEGLPMDQLSAILESIARTADLAEVKIVAGDTKVVPRGHADKIFINTAGLGLIPPDIHVGVENARPGDYVLVSGSIGDHGLTILMQREGLRLQTPLRSDSAPLNKLVEAISPLGPKLHVLRDPTRGGVATALNEIAQRSAAGIRLHEDALPFKSGVLSAAEILGIDPLYAANEGIALVIAAPDAADAALASLRLLPEGRDARLIGEVTDELPGKVLLQTRVGGTRILPMLSGQQLPRIC